MHPDQRHSDGGIMPVYRYIYPPKIRITKLLWSAGNNDVRTVIRPPVRSNGRSYKMLVMFSFFQRVISELPQPITAKLRHMIAACVYFIN